MDSTTPLDPGSIEETINADSSADVDAAVGVEALPPGFGLAVISGLVEDVEVVADGKGTHVRMAWPSTVVTVPGAQ